jgi:hypothetical protein
MVAVQEIHGSFCDGNKGRTSSALGLLPPNASDFKRMGADGAMIVLATGMPLRGVLQLKDNLPHP